MSLSTPKNNISRVLSSFHPFEQEQEQFLKQSLLSAALSPISLPKCIHHKIGIKIESPTPSVTVCLQELKILPSYLLLDSYSLHARAGPN